MIAEEEKLLSTQGDTSHLNDIHRHGRKATYETARHSQQKKAHRRHRSCNRFGVRDHLEHFYGEEIDEWSADEVVLENQAALYRRALRLPGWRGITYIGAVMMSVAVVLLALGHGIPQQDPVLGDRDGIELIQTSALTFNRTLRTCQIVGLALFCAGGLFIAGGLLIGAFCSLDDTVCGISAAVGDGHRRRHFDSSFEVPFDGTGDRRATKTSSSSSSTSSKRTLGAASTLPSRNAADRRQVAARREGGSPRSEPISNVLPATPDQPLISAEPGSRRP